MEKQSTFLSELISGNTFYTSLNFNDYLSNIEMVKSGRNGVLTGIYGQFELNIAENIIHFDIRRSSNQEISLEYVERNENVGPDEVQLSSRFYINNCIRPKYIFTNPFTAESLEVKLDIINLIDTTPHLLTYPDKRKITPIFDPVIFYKKDTKEHLIIKWNNKRQVQRKEKEETKPLFERLVPQY